MISKRIVRKYLLDPTDHAYNDKFFFDLFVTKGLDFFSGRLRGNKVLNYLTPKLLRQLIDSNIPKKPLSRKKLIKILDVIGKYSISQADKKYIAFPDSGNSKFAIGGSIFAQFLNQNLIAFDRSAPISTIIETQLLAWLRELVGYKIIQFKRISTLSKIGGMWTPGGNLSNYISILAAFYNRFPKVKEKGLASMKTRPVLLITKGIDHYSYKNACSWLGLGSNAIVWVEPGENYISSAKIFCTALKKLNKSETPFYIVAVAGNCRTSGIDNINEIAAISKEHNLWFHVDACHGGSFLFSRKYRNLLDGIEKADSVSLDPHKSLFTPYASSYILFKNPGVMQIFSRYPEKMDISEYFDMGIATPFLGSRGFDSFKFWLTLKGIGIDMISKLIERRQELAEYWFSLLSKNQNIVMLNKLDFYRIAFVVFPKKRIEEIKKSDNYTSINSLISKYTHLISERLYKAGHICIDEFQLVDFNNHLIANNASYTVMGTTIGNASTDKETLRLANRILSNEINKIIEKYNNEITDVIGKNKKTITSDHLGTSNGPAGWA